MKTINSQRIVHRAIIAAFLVVLGAQNAGAQYTFVSGSDGSYGPMNITTNTTLALPPDGIFKCTTITVASDAKLTFTPNLLNTPVYLLAQGDVNINGTIDVSGSEGTALLGGAGGPGGFAGGKPSYSNLPPGDGYGPGAGRGGWDDRDPFGGLAGYGSLPANYYGTTNSGITYGSPLLIPLVGGSGGGGTGLPGIGGGGAILIASSARINLQGSISASSANPDRLLGFGSGGAIRLVAPIVAGAGTLNVMGGHYKWSTSYRGGNGRIRIDCMDRRSLTIGFFPDASVGTVGANMVVFPTNAPHLDITRVAGTNIAIGAGLPVSFTLPQGTPTNQTVTVQASGFGAVVPIRLTLTPDHGPSLSYDTNIDNTVNPASVTVPVVLPVNEQVQINAWTR